VLSIAENIVQVEGLTDEQYPPCFSRVRIVVCCPLAEQAKARAKNFVSEENILIFDILFWTLDLVLSNKGPIWQATKIPAQARLALCGGGRSLKHSNPKALLSSAGICSPPVYLVLITIHNY
jgi:hypothetical protein